MQINKSKKTSTSQSSGGLFDDDFASGFEDSKFDKFKPALKVLSVLVLLVGATWGVVAYFGSTDTKNDTDKNYTTDTVQQAEDTNSEAQDAEAAKINPDSDIQHSEDPTSSNSTQQPSSNGSTPATKSYDPSKCEPLNSEATRLRQAADQKKTTYDNAFAASKNYGDIYSAVRSEYGNNSVMYEAVKAESDRRYNAQEAQINQLRIDWQDALSKGNTAYSKYQECRASL